MAPRVETAHIVKIRTDPGREAAVAARVIRAMMHYEEAEIQGVRGETS
jgi:hypothetical protein